MLSTQCFFVVSLKSLLRLTNHGTTLPRLVRSQRFCSCRYSQTKKYSTSLNDFSTRPKRKHGNYDVVLPATVSPPRMVPQHIAFPEYVAVGIVAERPVKIELKSPAQSESMRKSCQIARFILEEASKQLQIGKETDEIDKFVHEMCIERGAYPSPLNYQGFPKSVCTSVNNVACHGIPDSRRLKDGDIVSIDVSVYYNGYHGDCAGTFGVGNVDDKGKQLMLVAKQCLDDAVQLCRPEQSFNSIGKLISKIALLANTKVVPSFCGHGIGSYFHGPPEILHYDNDQPGKMKDGMIFTIEPVISEGSDEIFILEDGWTAVTSDNSRAAQFEHTILITESGVEILTVI